MSPAIAPRALSFKALAAIAVGSTSRVDLCRVVGGERDGQHVAVKRLLPQFADDPAVRDMFLDEVWMTAALKHPNVVEVAGYGTDARGPYLAVELVEGVSLARLMKTVFDTGEAFNERTVVFVAAKICAGLVAAHALCSPEGEPLHLIHRDLTPGNVLVGFNGEVKIADFGLAKSKQRVTQTLTGRLKGQPRYMSPEQAKGEAEIDQRSDIFSLGVVLFELFAGRLPWSAESELESVQRAATEPPADLLELRPKIDKELVIVVNRCLARDRAERFQTAAELGERLGAWLSVHGYVEGTAEALGRFVRRNAMRQMRWFERALSGEFSPKSSSSSPSSTLPPPPIPSYTGGTREIVAYALGAGGRPALESIEMAGAGPAPGKNIVDSDPTLANVEADDDAARTPALEPGISRSTSTEDVDWGDEPPTIIQKSASAVARLRQLPVLPLAHVDGADEDSVRISSALGSASVGGQNAGGRLDGDERADRLPPSSEMLDEESSEHPTLQVQPGEATPASAERGGRAAIVAAANRLSATAARLAEEARVAAAHAEGKARAARQASEAAVLAAEAVRVATTHGIGEGRRRLEQALEASLATDAGTSWPPPSSARPHVAPAQRLAPTPHPGPPPSLADTRALLARVPPPTWFGVPIALAVGLIALGLGAFALFVWIVV